MQSAFKFVLEGPDSAPRKYRYGPSISQGHGRKCRPLARSLLIRMEVQVKPEPRPRLPCRGGSGRALKFGLQVYGLPAASARGT